MPTYYTCSIVTSTKEIFKDVKTKLGTPTTSVPGIPDRQVSRDLVYDNFSKVGVYYLTRDEYLNLTGSDILDKQIMLSAADNRDEIYNSNIISPELIDDEFATKTPNVQVSSSTTSSPIASLYPGGGYYDGLISGSIHPSSSIETASIWIDTIMPGFNNLSTRNGWYAGVSGRGGAGQDLDGLDGEHAGLLRSWHHAYMTSQDVNSVYSGSYDAAGNVTDGAEYTRYKYIKSSSTNDMTRDYVLDGTGVDVILMDDSWLAHLHADFFGPDGKTRVQYPNWYAINGMDPLKNPPYMYAHWDNRWMHNTMCAGVAVGTMCGLASGAHIYPMPVNLSATQNNQSKFCLAEAGVVVKRFHESKSIDPNTGYKRPTVVNMSMGYGLGIDREYMSWQALKYHEDQWEIDTWGATVEQLIWAQPNIHGANANGFYGSIHTWGPHTASIDNFNLQSQEGIRFEYMNSSYLFISSSDNTFGMAAFKNIKNNWHVNTFSGSISDLCETINNAGKYYYTADDKFMVSCSLDGSTLHMTTSFPPHAPVTEYLPIPPSGNPRTIQAAPISIYTGSFDATNWMFPFTTGAQEHTGSFHGYLGGPGALGPRFLNHIDSLIVNGVEKATPGTNNNFLTSDHGFILRPNKDIWGDDNTGKNPHNCSWNKTNAPTINGGQPQNLVHDAIFQELADAGVIVVKSAGNDSYLITQSGSAESNPYFDPDNYSPELDNYFTYDIDFGNYLAGEKVYYTRAHPGNGSAIIVSGIGEAPLHQSLLLANDPGYFSWSGSGQVANNDGWLDPQGTNQSPYPYNRIPWGNELPIIVGSTSHNHPNYNRSWNEKFMPVFNQGPGVDILSPHKRALTTIELNGAQLVPAPGQTMHIPEIDSQVNFDVESSIQAAYTASITSVQQTPGQPTVVPLQVPPEANSLNLDTWMDTGMSKLYSTETDGTSACAPATAGMICCWLQMNPWANVTDVRKWLKTMPNVMPNVPGNLLDKTYQHGYIDIDATGSRIPSGFRRDSGSIQLGGPNACTRVTHFPMMGSSPNPITFTGDINFTGTSLK